MKTCNRCHVAKALEDFYKKSSSPDGRAYECKACRKLLSQQIYARDREKILVKNRQWQKEHPDQMNNIRQAWRNANPGKAMEYDRKRQAIHHDKIRSQARARYDPEKAKIKNDRIRKERPEMVKEAKRNWNRAHPEKNLEYSSKRRARLNGARVNDLTAAQWEDIKREWEYTCAYCDAKPETLTKDHVIPLSKGGDHTASNIVPACQSCNSRKSNRQWDRPKRQKTSY